MAINFCRRGLLRGVKLDASWATSAKSFGVRQYPHPICKGISRDVKLPGCSSGCEPDIVFDLDGVSDQAAGPLDKCELVGEAALKEHADAKVSGDISHRDQGHVFGNAKVDQVVGLGHDKESLYRRGLDLSEFTPEVLDEHIFHAAANLNGLLADKFEASVQRAKVLVLEKSARLQRFLDVRVLRGITEFLIYLCHSLSALPDIAQHLYEEFLVIFHRHRIFLHIYFRSGNVQ